MKTKQCFKCGETLPLREFYKHPRMADGHLNKCKSCAKNDAKIRQATSARVVEYERERWERPERKAAVRGYLSDARARDPERFREYARQSYARHPEKRRARIAVGNAVRDGRLTRGSCEKCGEAKTHAHHDDYSKPLDVRWLCSKCHGLEHRRR